MSSFDHKPVMLAEVVAWLHPMPNGVFFDGTLGGGGHACAILEATSPRGTLLGCDRDGVALEAASSRLASYGDRVRLCRGNFADVAADCLPGTFDGVLLDLGVSSPQLDEPDRGFSFLRDGPLDMRQDRDLERTAADWVNAASESELTGIFRDLGEDPNARRIARRIVAERGSAPFRTTRQLAETVERAVPRAGHRRHPATRIFQALRVIVNDELGALERGLPALWRLLRISGRLVVLAYQSGEDRILKAFARQESRGYEVEGPVDRPEFRRPVAPTLKRLTRKAISASEAEIRDNPRARSARLRAYEKIAVGGGAT